MWSLIDASKDRIPPREYKSECEILKTHVKINEK